MHAELPNAPSSLLASCTGKDAQARAMQLMGHRSIFDYELSSPRYSEAPALLQRFGVAIRDLPLGDAPDVAVDNHRIAIVDARCEARQADGEGNIQRAGDNRRMPACRTFFESKASQPPPPRIVEQFSGADRAGDALLAAVR